MMNGTKWVLAVAVIFVMSAQSAAEKDKKMKYNKLTPDEERVILGKGTEAPFSGKYYRYKEKGVYVCKRCGTPLYESGDKFDSQCGWPSFDDEIDGAVERKLDADGVRTEILCSRCGAHLGHVFLGERLTAKNVRHCVNSISLSFVSAKSEDRLEKAYFAGGCFWGVEYFFENAEGVKSARSGFMGGHVDRPSYREVCSGATGHAETLEVVFDPGKTSFEALARLFFEIHDPEQVNRQGPDVGEQYRSAIFYANEEQKRTAEKLIKILEGKGYKIATEVSKASAFWEAEDYHQDYYEKNGKVPYCHARKQRF